MSNDVFGIDFGEVSEERSKRGPLNEGEYTVEIEKAEMKETKKKDGYYVNLQMRVCDMDKFNGAVVFDLINFKNKSKDAQEIGRGRMKRLLQLAGVKESEMKNAGPDNLIGKKYNAYLTIKCSAEYGDKNKVASYSKAGKVGVVVKEQDVSKDIPTVWT